MKFSELLIRIRATLNLSQEQLATRLGVAFATVNRWENNKSKPSKRHCYVISRFCEQNNIKI